MIKLKLFIIKNGIKQVEIAQEIGATPAQISSYLNGWTKLPVKYKEKLADFLGVSVNEVEKNEVQNEL